MSNIITNQLPKVYLVLNKTTTYQHGKMSNVVSFILSSSETNSQTPHHETHNYKRCL